MLSMWTIYDHPSDFPGCFVARLWRVTSSPIPVPTGIVIKRASLDELRIEMLRMGLTPIARSDDDDPVIVETWLE